MLYNITFSIPEDKIIHDIPQKKKLISNLIPGKLETYIYNTEEEYYKEYQESLFAITMKKGGWDCMRHYEIIANGCLPYFIDIENCPTNTMTLLPKDIILECNTLYEKISSKTETEQTQYLQNNVNEYQILIQKILTYIKENLTTKEIAKYILDKTNHTNKTKILYLSGDTSPDYLRCLTLHGFKTIYGSNCHDSPKVPHIYKSTICTSNLYGKGITYTNTTASNLHDDNKDTTIEEDIKNKYYDIIIYGSYHRGMPYYDIISKIYNPNEIILLCGEDLHDCNYNNYISKGHHVFVREL